MMRYTRSFLALLIFLAISAEGLAGLWTTNEFIYKPSQGARGEREKSTYDSGLDRVDVRLAKEVWVGDPKFGATLQDAITALGATTAVLRVPKGTCNLDANLTIPPNITLKPERGAIFAIANAKTLTINGGLEAGLYQVFSCTGTGKVVFAAGSNQSIFPQWWGASPSASAAVNTAAIQASFTALADYTSWTLPPGEYTCNASLVLGSYTTPIYGLTMDFKGKLRFDTCSGLDIRYVRYSDLRGIKVKRTVQDWSANNFGVKFGKCRRSSIGLDYIEDFTYGFYLDGNSATGDSNAYMTFNLGYIAENQYGEYVTSVGSGWNNEISYYGGQFGSNRTDRTAYTNVSVANDTLTHATGWISTFVTGFAVYVTVPAGETGNLPSPLLNGTTYYLIKVDSTTIKLAASYADAIAGIAIDLTSQGDSTLILGKSGSWGVYFASPALKYDNHRWYGTNFEAMHNGMYLAGYTGAMQMFLSHPRFEQIANWIEAAPRNLVWIQGAEALGRTQIVKYCPRIIGTDGKSIVDITSSGYADLDSYLSKAAPKDAKTSPGNGAGGMTFYNPLDLWQVTDWRNQVKDYFTLKQGDGITDYGSTPRSVRWTYSFPMNKGFEGTAGPTTAAAGGMTYAKNAVVWNTIVAPGQPMGWVCSKSGSAVRGPTVSAVGNVTGTTLTMTTADYSKYFFVGAFILINGVKHQIMKEISWDTVTGLGVFTLYANNLGGDVTGATVANDPPTWIPMANFVSNVATPAIPASTVEQRNTNAFPCRVTITGGTVTVIKKGPTSGSLITTGATAGAFILEPNEYISITYSVAPTWVWLGM